MEKLDSRVSRSPYEEMRVFMKAKNASPELAKEIKPNLDFGKKETPKKDRQYSVRNQMVTTRSKGLLNTLSKYELKKVFQSRFSGNSVTNWGSRNPYLHRSESLIRKEFVRFSISICTAVLVGVVMGLSILSLFFSNHTNRSDNAIDSHLPRTKLENRVTALPRLHIVMLQAGTFSEEDGAQKAVEKLRAQGIGAVMSYGSPFRVFLGLAPSNEEAEKLARVYQKENVDVYQKELDIRTKIGLTPDQRKLESVIKKGNHLISQLSKRSSEGILTGSSFPFNAEKISQQFYREAQEVMSHLPVQGQEKLNEMNMALKRAVQSANRVPRNSSQTTMWKVQEELVRYVIAYEKLIHILSSVR